MALRRTASAAAVVSAVCAAAVEPRGPTSPASIAPTETSGVLHTQGLGCRDVAMTATIHGILPAVAIALA
jgi:hypothetical protein